MREVRAHPDQAIKLQQSAAAAAVLRRAHCSARARGPCLQRAPFGLQGRMKEEERELREVRGEKKMRTSACKAVGKNLHLQGLHLCPARTAPSALAAFKPPASSSGTAFRSRKPLKLDGCCGLTRNRYAWRGRKRDRHTPPQSAVIPCSVDGCVLRGPI